MPTDPRAQIRSDIDTARAALDSIDRIVSERPPPRPEPDPPPRPRPDPIPQRGTIVTAEVWDAGGTREFVGLSVATASPWAEYPDNAGEYRSKHVRLGDAHLWVWWERTPGGTWPTVLLTPRKGAGAQRWSRVRFSVDGQRFYDLRGDNADLLPMQAHLATTRPTDASGWDFIDDRRPYPEWSESAMQADTANRRGNVFMGRPFFWYDWTDKGNVPVEPGAPAGFGVGSHSAGKDDAFCGPAGKGNRWAECIGEWWKAIWRLDDDGQPALVDGPYWSGRDYATNPVEGYEWS
ncbi:MAG TPA: hypothetical protein VFH61_08845, partial [Thermoleophilia bacterium]|nr:hypothetical protein [Thermoleophilia bacterium]